MTSVNKSLRYLISNRCWKLVGEYQVDRDDVVFFIFYYTYFFWYFHISSREHSDLQDGLDINFKRRSSLQNEINLLNTS